MQLLLTFSQAPLEVLAIERQFLLEGIDLRVEILEIVTPVAERVVGSVEALGRPLEPDDILEFATEPSPPAVDPSCLDAHGARASVLAEA
jgi:hypothetical protein